MRKLLIWGVLISVALVLLITILQHDSAVGSRIDDWGMVVYHLALIALVGGSTAVMFRGRWSEAIEAALFWMVIGFVLLVGYSYRSDLNGAAQRIMSELMPGRTASRGERVVEIVRGRGGDFQVLAQLNGTRVAMALDTGASAVVLTQDAARSAGLPLEMLNYSVQVDTANGRTRAAAVTLDRLTVGDIIERNVPALIAQPGQLRTSLLGMSFLDRLESWEVRGDRLSMRGKPDR